MLFMRMPPHMLHVRIMNVTYHLESSSVLTMGWYFWFFFNLAIGVGS
jgi:hypothetical protein